jgi:hypothetical protein
LWRQKFDRQAEYKKIWLINSNEIAGPCVHSG